ncbi:MAG: hypothetical protein ACRD2W_13025 [Acidimicrobiales bacterium]
MLRVWTLYAEDSYGDVKHMSEMETPGLGAPGLGARELEALCRGLLLNAAARRWAASGVEPEPPSAEYLTGFAAGWEGGEMAALALVISLITEESATRLVEEARAQASVDAVFPFELHIEVTPADEEAA